MSLSLYGYAHECRCPQRPEDPLQQEYREPDPDRLQEQQVLLSAEPALQPRSAPKILSDVGFLLYDQVAGNCLSAGKMPTRVI